MYNIDTHSGPSFSIKNRLLRVVWNCIYALVFRHSPRPFHTWRSFILKLFGAKIGKNVHVYPKVIIWAPWNIELGDEVGIANGVELYSQGKIKIGNRSVISQGTYICTGSHDYTLKEHPLYTKDVSIGANVWVAAQSFIHPGVCIEDGVVVGARSVVIKNLPRYTVCSGNPCAVIKPRILK
jgi:putative colanic acid biosynthesis acetyltransferase WcaF